mmetsp:Transcript_43820/g.83658  ORF Transcript_43820/g.83658 Transcript_43820/m.83658 type:complete len:208 (+) Transcript_43820:329-952(+)
MASWAIFASHSGYNHLVSKNSGRPYVRHCQKNPEKMNQKENSVEAVRPTPVSRNVFTLASNGGRRCRSLTMSSILSIPPRIPFRALFSLVPTPSCASSELSITRTRLATAPEATSLRSFSHALVGPSSQPIMAALRSWLQFLSGSCGAASAASGPEARSLRERKPWLAESCVGGASDAAAFWDASSRSNLASNSLRSKQSLVSMLAA